MPNKFNLPWWLKPANKVVIAFNRVGLALGTQEILSVRGRNSGKMRSTPVSLLTVDGKRYICTVGDTEWVKNARAAGSGYLSRGPKRERVRLVELDERARGPVLREFPVQVPHGVQFFKLALGLDPDPDAFAAAAPHCRVFRIEIVTKPNQKQNQ